MEQIVKVFALIVALIVVFFVGTYCLFNAKYLKFAHKKTSYYVDFVKACDSLLMQHPLGTNKVIMVSVTDPSLPKIVSDLHPIKIGLLTNYVGIMVSEGHIGGLAIIWKPRDETQTHVWNLSINDGEGQSKVVYVVNR